MEYRQVNYLLSFSVSSYVAAQPSLQLLIATIQPLPNAAKVPFMMAILPWVPIGFTGK
ncbi:MAG: hypothetical protein WCF65_05530 [Parachlamydiaceae bacterium]